MLCAEYLAGLFDGEGWVRSDDFIPKNRIWPRYQVICGIAMTYEPIITMIHQQFGGHIYGDDSFTRRYHKNRTIWRWGVSSNQALPFLELIEPHVFVKREQIILAITLQKHISANKSKMVGHADEAFKIAAYGYRKEIHDQLREIKKHNYINTQMTLSREG